MTNLEIEAFISICRHKSISKAADELFITQSALSSRLKSLENDLGCTLILRSKGARTIALTNKGQEFYYMAVQYIDLINQMSKIGESAAYNKLRVSSISSIGNYLLPDVFAEFVKIYPTIHLIVQAMSAEAACKSIMRGNTDLAFSTAKVQTEQIYPTPFLTEPMVIVCNKKSAYPEIVNLNMLKKEDEVYVFWCDDYISWHDINFGAPDLNSTVLEMTGQVGTFVASSDKWAIVPKSVADILTEDDNIRQCTPGFAIPMRSVYILRDKENTNTANIHYFLDVTRQVLTEKKIVGLLL